MEFMGDPILPGDILHDLVDGPITVVSVHKDHMRAMKGCNRNTLRTYDFCGVLKGRRSRRTLFWHDPIVVEPRKSETAWLQQLKSLRAQSELIGEIAMAYENGCPTHVPPPKTEQDRLADFIESEKIARKGPTKKSGCC